MNQGDGILSPIFDGPCDVPEGKCARGLGCLLAPCEFNQRGRKVFGGEDGLAGPSSKRLYERELDNPVAQRA